MNVQSLGHHQHEWGHFRPEFLNDSQQDSVKLNPATAQTQSTTATDQSQNDSERGVLRLLQEGHFQGAAEIHLSLNFQYMAQSQATQQGINAVEKGAQEISGGIDEKLQQVLGSSTVSTALSDFTDSFSSALDQIVTDTKSGQNTPTGALDKIRGAFKDLITSLQNALGSATNSTNIPTAGETSAQSSDLGIDTQGLVQNTTDQSQEQTQNKAEQAQVINQDATATNPQTAAEDTGAENIVPSDYSSALNSLKTWLEDHVSGIQQEIQTAQSQSVMGNRHAHGHGHGRGNSYVMEIYININSGTDTSQTSTDQTTAIDAMV